MDYQRFVHQLSAHFDDWGQDTVHPKDGKFQQALNQIQGMTTANVMQVLNFAVECLEADELYCEIGTYRGSTLIGALLDQGDRAAYAVDNFSEFDPEGNCLEALFSNLEQFSLEQQVYFCNQDFQQFFLELNELGTEDKIGVYFYDGAHDYRSTLLGLLLAKPFLADRALILLDDANWGTVQQACWDFLALTPEAEVLLELFTPVARFPTFWNGIQILSWNRTRQYNYSATTFSEKNRKPVIQSIYNLHLLEHRNDSLEVLLQEAIQLQDQNQFKQAEKKYQDYLLWRDNDPRAWLNLGLLYYQTEDFQQSLSALLKSIEYDSENGTLYYYAGCVLDRLGQSEPAIAAYQQAIRYAPDLLDAYNNLGNAFVKSRSSAQAEQVYRQAIAIDPAFAGTHLNLGNLLFQQGELAAAIAAYQTAIELNPEDENSAQSLKFAQATASNPADYHRFYAEQFYQQSNYSIALDHFQNYLEIQPVDSSLAVKLSECFWHLGQTQAAIACLRSAIQNEPTVEQLHYDLAIKLSLNNQTEEALSAIEIALVTLPDSYTFRVLKALILPLVYQSPEEIGRWRDRYSHELQNLIQTTQLETPDQCESALNGMGRFSSFYLTYQGQSMVDLQQMYGALAHQIVATNYPDWIQPIAMPAVRSKIRIGYVSNYFHSYSGTLWLTGWLKHCDRQKFEVHCYYTGNASDLITQEFQNYSDVFHHIPDNLAAVAQQILADELHLLIYPEIGMNPATIQLAALRLAPVQCTAWGHPVTSGLSTIDYYLSSVAMEPDDAQLHYSETLIHLPKLGIAYPKPQIPPVTKSRADFGLTEDAIVYLCCQAPFKYLPQHDHLLVEIARRVPQAQFVFIRADMLKPRLANAFSKANLDYQQYCTFLPTQNRLDYLMLNQLADVYLDTIAFTGGNTTFDAVACSLPIVTLPGEFMRGRLSYGILQVLEVTDTIADSEANYINIAVRLGQEPEWRKDVAIAMQHQQNKIFDEVSCVSALEEFYQSIVMKKS
jgi:protein O-GlcNAc transferase